MSENTPPQGTVFLPPYGEKDQHVIGAKLNRGFRWLVASMVHTGYAGSLIIKACEEAYEEGAPLNAVKKRSGRWLSAEEYEGTEFHIAWAEYANILAAHEQYIMPSDVWATTDDPNWLDQNSGIREVLIVHNVPRHVADLVASRIRLVSTGSGTVVTVRPSA